MFEFSINGSPVTSSTKDTKDLKSVKDNQPTEAQKAAGELEAYYAKVSGNKDKNDILSI